MATNVSSLSLRSVLEKDKLTGTNFLDWYRNVRIVLTQERKLYVLDNPIPEQPAANAPRAQKDAYEKHQNDSVDVACLMLVTMVPEIQKNLENKGAYEMITHLKEMFQVQARQERFETSKALYSCKMAEGGSVSAHVLKMQGHIDHLARLGFPILPELATDLILHSLPRSYDQFVLNFNMNGMEKSVSELHGMLKTAEASIKKAPSTVLLVQNKGKGKGKGKRKGDAEVGGTKPAAKPNPPPAKKAKTSKDAVCFFCQKPGHWRRNCKLYMEDLKKKKNEASTSGIFVIGVHLSTPTTWVLDTACGSHICTNVQGLRGSRKLSRGEVDLRVGNGARVAAVAVGTYELVLPTGLVLSLNNCYYVPCLSSNIISLSYLDKEGFICVNGNGKCSIYKDDVLYAYGDLHDNHYILELKQRHNDDIYNIDTKRIKVGEPNPTYLWHCRLGHINERRLEKLHRDGLLSSFDFESYDACESCLLGKMTKAPFTGQSERASDLLGIIHSDVCGPMSVQARGGYSYFITFTDDFSRYGYIYLMKHKSESFEMFKRFQNEVENQLDKKIKILRSDRGGEYLSQEFTDHLSGCGIVSQLTPPGTPQWNGVSERRNRTLLDMVRSMMSQTDLPPSFWGYALEAAAFTLNRVPSKAVEKTPYEIWKGKSPNLSYLKVWGCEVYVKQQANDKLSPKSLRCLFVGYPKETKGYYVYCPTDNKVFVVRSGFFLEKDLVSKRNSGSKIELEEVQVPQDTSEAQTETGEVPQGVVEAPPQTQGPRRSDRTRFQPERYYGYLVTENKDVLLTERGEPNGGGSSSSGSGQRLWTSGG